MAEIEASLVAHLKATAGIAALVSTRVYGMVIPQGATLPCVVITRISTPRTLTMDTSGATGDLTSPRFQFDAWSETHASSFAISKAIRAAMNGATGSIGSGATTTTIRASLENQYAPTWEPEAELYRGRSEFIIWLQEA